MRTVLLLVDPSQLKKQSLFSILNVEFFLQATVGFSLFGKETLADIDVKEIVAEVG